jgi:hypothetical protein
VTSNWNPSRIKGYKVYNTSIIASDITEQKLILEQILPQRKTRLLLMSILPYLTRDHVQKEDAMYPRAFWSALGSVNLLNEYIELLWHQVSGRSHADPANGAAYFDYEVTPNWQATEEAGLKLNKTDPVVVIDPIAFNEYRDVLEQARSNGAEIVGFTPPIYRSRYLGYKSQYDEYYLRMRSLFRPNERILDFNGPTYVSFSSNPDNFVDAAHFTRTASEFLTDELSLFLGK